MKTDGLDRDRIGWWAIALALGGFVIFLLYSFVGTFVFGVFLYYATRPLYRRIKRVIGQPSLAAAFSLVAIALPVILLAAYTIAIGLQELSKFINTQDFSARPIESILEPYFDISGVITDPQSLLTQPNAIEAIQEFLAEAGTYLGFFGTVAIHLIVVIILAFYLLRDDHRLASWWGTRFSDDEGVMQAYMARVDRDFSNIFFGNILNAVITAIVGAGAYWAVDLLSPAAVSLPYPTLLGLLTGVASLIPVVGMKLVYVPVALYLFLEAINEPAVLWFPVLFVLVSFVIVDVLPDLILRPYVSGRNLHLGMVMLAYIFGPLLFGWYGLFLGPMLLVLVVHFVALVLPELLAGAPIQPEVVTDPLSPGGGGSPSSDDTGDSSGGNSGGEPGPPAENANG
ncbi:MAG: AI-2E family transporter [Halodesulfurarchaeum sp.]